MANDFKRMWTEEELKDTFKIILNEGYNDDFVIDGLTKDYLDTIKKYNRVELQFPSGTKALYNKTMDDGAIVVYTKTGETYIEEFILGYDMVPDYYITRDTFFVTKEDDFKDLVRVTQRRLDKPSAEWDSSTSSEDFGTWLQEHLPNIYQHQFCYFSDELGDYNLLCYVNKKDGYFEIKPLGISSGVNGIVMSIQFMSANNEISIYETQVNNIEINTLSFNDVSEFVLY